MGKFGGAYYCNGCGVEIISGACCSECDPQNGSSEISFTFIAEGKMSPDAQQIVDQAQSSGKQGFISWLLNGGK